MLKGKICQQRILYLEKEVKTFLNKQKLREFVITRPALQDMLGVVLQGEMEGH